MSCWSPWAASPAEFVPLKTATVTSFAGCGLGSPVGAFKHAQGRVVHLSMIGLPGRFGKSRTAQASRGKVLLQAAATEKAEHGEHKDDDQDDPEDAHVVLLWGRLVI